MMNEEVITLAERITWSELKPNDRFVLVYTPEMRAASKFIYKSGPVGTMVRGENDLITVLNEQTAVFTLEESTRDWFRIHAPEGYLTTSDRGRTLTFSSERNELCDWDIDSEGHLYIPLLPEWKNGERMVLAYWRRYRQFILTAERESAELSKDISIFRIREDYEPETDDGKGYRVSVFESADIHGYIADTENEQPEYRMAWIAARVNNERRKRGEDGVVLVDGGDIFHGANLSNVLRGEPLSEVFAYMNYDAVTIGNHEFEWELSEVFDDDQTLRDYTAGGVNKSNLIPVLSSNIYQNNEKLKYAKDYLILEKTAVNEAGEQLPVRIGVVGFTEDFSKLMLEKKFHEPGYEIREDYDALKTLCRTVKQEEACDALILLTHTDAPAAAGRVDPSFGVDLVLGAHMHFADFGISPSGIPYLMPGENARCIGFTELVFQQDENGKPAFCRCAGITNLFPKAKDLRNTEENLSNGLLERKVIEITDQAISKAAKILNVKIGYITESVARFSHFPQSGNRSSTGGNWYTWITAMITGSDISFINEFGMRANLDVPQGEQRRDVTVGDIYSLFPFGNISYRYEVTWEEALRVFEYALTKEGYMLLTKMSGVQCYFTGTAVNALIYHGKPIYINGTWYDGMEKETVRIGVSLFLATSKRPTETGLLNPLYVWKKEGRAEVFETPDNEAAAAALKKIAAENDGHIPVDHTSWFVEGEYILPDSQS